MAWLHKIPPMMSALAFGYGVGMAAPESTIDTMRTAVGPAGATPARGVPVAGRAPMPTAWAGQAPPPGWAPYGYYVAMPPGAAPPGATPPRRHVALGAEEESSELARLRSSEGASCKIAPRSYSEPPSTYAEEPGDEEMLEDELDPAGRDALSRLQLPDFPVAVTRSAIKYVRFLTRTHRGRGLFESWLKRSGRYSEMIQQTLREWHLPEDLIWVAMIESGFDPDIKSPAGAMGLWQFMKSTGSVYGLEVNKHHDQRKNPVLASRAAAHHLRDLYQRFGAWDLALAAYNMGYEQLLNRIDRYGTTDFAELARQRGLPRETTAYVPKIVAAALVANNLERYGFGDVKIYKPFHYSELTVPGGAPMATIAKASGISLGKLRNFNPHIYGKYVPPGPSYTVMVPPTSLSRARAALPAMLDSKLSSNDADVLLPGNLVGLSGTGSSNDTWTEDENLLRLLPKPKRRSMRTTLANHSQTVDPSMKAVAEEFSAPKRTDREVVMYRVGKGDTLIGVARQFAIDIDDLARDNGLDAEDQLKEGALLKLMVKKRVLKKWRGKADRASALSASDLRVPKKRKKRRSSPSKRRHEG